MHSQYRPNQNHMQQCLDAIWQIHAEKGECFMADIRAALPNLNRMRIAEAVKSLEIGNLIDVPYSVKDHKNRYSPRTGIKSVRDYCNSLVTSRVSPTR